MNAPKPIDWLAVEEAIRRWVRGRGTSQDRQLVTHAYQRDPVTYSKLSRYVCAEEQEAFRRSGGLP